DEETLFFTEEEWDSHVKPDKIILLWTEDRPPSGFFVLWENSLGRAWLPVNIASSTCLPPPQELKDLPLDVLITILTSARPLHRALGNYLKRKKTGKSGPEIPKGLVDPHTRVDTSKFLLQRSRRVSWALNAIRERIERPAVSEEGVRWRLRGPVGAMAFAEALNREAHSEEEKAFLITELALELARAKPKEAPNCFPVDKIQDEIQGVIRELKQKIPSDRLENLNNLKTYVNDVFGTILK
ncbi:MAG: hypothetical protein KAH24_01220, partial [Holophagae bacterium]|nr:hypothetical protein [Holophagae bacterium]